MLSTAPDKNIQKVPSLFWQPPQNPRAIHRPDKKINSNQNFNSQEILWTLGASVSVNTIPVCHLETFKV